MASLLFCNRSLVSGRSVAHKARAGSPAACTAAAFKCRRAARHIAHADVQKGGESAVDPATFPELYDTDLDTTPEEDVAAFQKALEAIEETNVNLTPENIQEQIDAAFGVDDQLQMTEEEYAEFQEFEKDVKEEFGDMQADDDVKIDTGFSADTFFEASGEDEELIDEEEMEDADEDLLAALDDDEDDFEGEEEGADDDDDDDVMDILDEDGDDIDDPDTIVAIVQEINEKWSIDERIKDLEQMAAASAEAEAQGPVLVQEYDEVDKFFDEYMPGVDEKGAEYAPPEFKLNFLWLEQNIAVSVDQVYAKGGKAPLTEYFFWPRKDAWDELRQALEARPWIDERAKVILLNRTTEVINFWQDEEAKHTPAEARDKFPDCTFTGK